MPCCQIQYLTELLKRKYAYILINVAYNCSTANNARKTSWDKFVLKAEFFSLLLYVAPNNCITKKIEIESTEIPLFGKILESKHIYVVKNKNRISQMFNKKTNKKNVVICNSLTNSQIHKPPWFVIFAKLG